MCGLTMAALAGCRSEMYDQPRYEPMEASGFFKDGTSARPLVEGTVPQSTAYAVSTTDGVSLLSAFKDGRLVTSPPFPVDRKVLERGQQRYRIYCVPCHGELGDGQGIIVLRGFTRPPDYTSELLLNQPLGHFFEVITHGYGAMYSYAAHTTPGSLGDRGLHPRTAIEPARRGL